MTKYKKNKIYVSVESPFFTNGCTVNHAIQQFQKLLMSVPDAHRHTLEWNQTVSHGWEAGDEVAENEFYYWRDETDEEFETRVAKMKEVADNAVRAKEAAELSTYLRLKKKFGKKEVKV